MTRHVFRRFTWGPLPTAVLSAAVWMAGPQLGSAEDRFVRHRQPDRGTYQPPELPAGDGLQGVVVDDLAAGATPPAPASRREPTPEHAQAAERPIRRRPAAGPVDRGRVEAASARDVEPVRQVAYETRVIQSEPETIPAPPGALMPPQPGESVPVPRGNPLHSPDSVPAPPPLPLSSMMGVADGCDSGLCGPGGCDAVGCDGLPHRSPLGRRLADRWFGSLDLLLMFRSGDSLPPLVTSTVDDDPAQATAGRLGEDDTVVLAGADTVLKDMTAGGRLSLGTWLDRYKDRSVVFRGWFAGEETFGFSADQSSAEVLTRPFFNVTDGVEPGDETLIIALPDLAQGRVSVQADSNVYGGDVSMRQLWHKGYGGTIDLLYGYQYMGLDESLAISSHSTSLDGDFNPVGSIRAITDRFDVENDFHGGQIGVATNYRQGCWSFSSLAKIGFGSISRRAELTGSDFRSIDGNNFTDPNGLLVRSTNRGVSDDDTFGWVPELDLTLGWQRFPSFDVTFGYHLVVMTDALQVSGAIDPNLATNLAENPSGAQRPSPIFRHDTFYVQGLHFGLTYIH